VPFFSEKEAVPETVLLLFDSKVMFNLFTIPFEELVLQPIITAINKVIDSVTFFMFI
jgi:hypothetical protein